MRILVLGAGALGGYYGGRLAAAGADVTFLVREARAKKLADAPLEIESHEGDLAIMIKTITSAEGVAPFDLILLSCKAYDLDSAIAAVKPAVGSQTTVLPMLNGHAHYPVLDAAFGQGNVLGGLCYIMATLSPEGKVRHLGGPPAAMTFGERDGGMSPRVEAIAAAFAPAKFVSRASTNVMQDSWEKFCLIAALAGATCLMRASTGTILATRDGDKIIRAFYAECGAVAASAEHPLREKSVETTLGMIANPARSSTASMLRDLESGQRVEAAQLVGDLVTQAEAKGLSVPLLTAAYCHLQCYEAQRAAT